jgi:L-aminopeptidase/D-esterase-like protein
MPETNALDAITDVAGIRVGHWTDRDAATGCTVVLCGAGAVAGVDVRGAAPGTRETELLRPGHLVQQVHAVVLAGGSAFGLDAAGGVMRYLEEQGVGYAHAGVHIPIVPAAILMDLDIGRGDVRPDAEAGHEACRAAKDGPVEQGSVGAGTGATVAKALGMERCLKGGLGSASERSDAGLVVGALAAVNAAGDIVEPGSGRVLAASRADGGGFIDTLAAARKGELWSLPSGSSTTLVVVATNAALSKEQANRLATVCHDGIARAVRPVHTMGDGDIVFTLATGALTVDVSGYRVLEFLAARAVERAIVRGVEEAVGLAGVPSPREWREGSI